MKVLVTGANGFLGQHLCMYLKNKNLEVIGAGRNASRIPAAFNVPFYNIDFTQKDLVEEMLFALQPDSIIHTAAISKPDDCENNRSECLLQNVEATKFLIQGFENIDAEKKHFIFTSTDFIFGENGPHSEDDNPAPLNFYGESKLMAEKIVENFSQLKTIVRPVFMYGNIWEGLRPSFLHWVKNNLEQNKKIKVVSDQWRTPTFVDDVCEGIFQIISKEKEGTFHLAGKEILSPYLMALQVAEVLNLEKSLIENVTADTFPEPVKRAKRSGLKIDKAVNELGYNPASFSDGIKFTFN